MSIQFAQIPTNILTPGVYIEINSSAAATTSGDNERILVIGQRLSTSSVSALVPTLITSYQQAVSSFGAGSMLADMFNKLFLNNTTTEKWAIALDDVSGGTAASGNITVTATSVLAGTISLYIGDVLISVNVSDAQTAAQIATSIAAAISANSELPVIAAVDGTLASKVNLTYKHKGTVGNKLTIQTNFLGVSAGEVLPSGVTLAITQLTGGVTDPELDDAFSVMPSKVFNYILIPYTNSTNLNFADTEMDSRWLPTRMLGGHVFTAERGSVSTLGTLGNSRNSEHMTIFDAGLNSPNSNYQWAAATIGKVAINASADPATGFKDLELVGILAPPEADRRTQSENETLLHDGIATHYIGNDGKVYIQRLLTTYQLSGAGIPDNTYLDANTPFTLFRICTELMARLSSRFARVKLADDGTNTAPGSGVVTPSIIKAEVIAIAQEWASKGWIEHIADFITSCVVERATDDQTRVNIVIYPNLVNQLQVVGVKVQFTL